MWIYRIEDSKGYGIFHSTNSKPKKIFECCKEMDNPFYDLKKDHIFEQHRDYCAFKRITQVFRHIPQDILIDLLTECGFKLYKIKVYFGKSGKEQICYKKEDIIEKIDITNEIIN